MNFTLKQGTLTEVEKRDILKMLKNNIGIAFKNGNEYNIHEKRGERRTIKVSYYCDVKKKKVIKAVIVLFNLLKKQVA